MRLSKIDIYFTDDSTYGQIMEEVEKKISQNFEPRFYNLYIKGHPGEFFKRFGFIYRDENGEEIDLPYYEDRDIFKAEIERRLKILEERMN